jgi:hypothetical protein
MVPVSAFGEKRDPSDWMKLAFEPIKSGVSVLQQLFAHCYAI